MDLMFCFLLKQKNAIIEICLGVVISLKMLYDFMFHVLIVTLISYMLQQISPQLKFMDFCSLRIVFMAFDRQPCIHTKHQKHMIIFFDIESGI